jgi:hypothetical protein
MVRVSGDVDLRKVAEKIRKAQRDLPGALDKGLVSAGHVVEREIRGSTDTYMPRGYEQVFRRALVIKVQLNRGGPTRSVTLTGSAFGSKGNPRKVEGFERGRLKHPVFGRARELKSGRAKRNPWVWQKIKPGWFSEPAKKATPRAVAEVNKAVKGVTDQAN